MIAVSPRRSPAPVSDVLTLVRLRRRTRRLLWLRRGGVRRCQEFGVGLSDDERGRLVGFGLFLCRTHYDRLGLLGEWRAVWASEAPR